MLASATMEMLQIPALEYNVVQQVRAAAEPLLPTGMYRVGKCCYWRSGNSTILLAPAWRGLHVGQLGWSREETQETYWRLQNFADDWDAPGMEAYDDL